MDFLSSKRIAFLNKLRNEVCSLPDTIAQNGNVSDEEYHDYRKSVVIKLSHLDNQISCYLNRYYSDKSVFCEEFKSYSFFPKGILFDSYNVENDRYWVRGKKDYLRFLDKLIDYAKTENQLKNGDTTKLILKLFVLLFVSVCTFFYLFVKEDLPMNIQMFLDGYIAKILILIVISLGTSLLLWFKEWRTLLPLLFTVIALYVTMLFTLNGRI